MKWKDCKQLGLAVMCLQAAPGWGCWGGVVFLVIRCKEFLVVVMESSAVVISVDPVWFPGIVCD